jgi:hypothetical protein
MKTNSELKDFYNNYFKDDDLPAFEELDAEQLRALNKSFAFAGYKANKVKQIIHEQIQKEVVGQINKIATAYKRLKDWARYV